MLFLIWIELELQNIVLAGDLCFSKILCDYFALARQPSKKALDYVGALLKPVIDIFICVFFRKILELENKVLLMMLTAVNLTAKLFSVSRLMTRILMTLTK